MSRRTSSMRRGSARGAPASNDRATDQRRWPVTITVSSTWARPTSGSVNTWPRTPLELLIDLGALGFEEDRRLWLESETALRGKRMLRWSPGLRERLLGEL